MNVIYVTHEQEYHDLETGEVAQIRQELSDGNVEWRRMDGSTWNGPMHDPSSKQLQPGWK